MSVDEEIREQRGLLERMDRGETTLNGGLMDCKAYGCPKEAVAKMGPYAGLCEEHAEIARKKNSEARRGGGGAKIAANGSGFAGEIRALLPLARAYDRAQAKLEALPAEDATAAEMEEAIRRVQAARTAENLERLAAAVKVGLKAHAPREKLRGEVEATGREFKAALATVARKAAA